MNIPDNLKYTNDHEWLKIEGDTATVGITEFAQRELGDIVYLEVETKGQTLEKEAAFGTIEAVKTVADLYMPVTGKVLEVNEVLEKTPEVINEDPYDKGWMIKISIDKKEELNSLLEPDSYSSIVNV